MNGADKLCHDIDQMLARLQKMDYLKQAGEFVRGQAVMLAPADSGYLRQNIYSKFEQVSKDVGEVTIYTPVQYAPYVEFGTGQKGEADHEGISPNVPVAYTLHPWWIHESQIDRGIAEKYHWFYIDTEDGRFYQCTGQPAQPFMYPAIHDNKDVVADIIKQGVEAAMKG